MTYVTAGIYGNWEKYNRLLQAIDLKDTDVLYVIGDVSDYGEQGMEVLTDMSMRANVYPVAGAHDFLALRMLAGFDKMLRDGASPTPEFAAEMMAWANDAASRRWTASVRWMLICERAFWTTFRSSHCTRSLRSRVWITC